MRGNVFSKKKSHYAWILKFLCVKIVFKFHLFIWLYIIVEVFLVLDTIYIFNVFLILCPEFTFHQCGFIPFPHKFVWILEMENNFGVLIISLPLFPGEVASGANSGHTITAKQRPSLHITPGIFPLVTQKSPLQGLR